MSAEEIIENMEKQMARLEKLAKLLFAILLMVSSGAVWAARMEWRLSESADVLKELRPMVTRHDLDIAVLKAKRPHAGAE